MLIVILLAVSVSFDTLGVAMAYAIGGIVIPRKTRLLIALLNGSKRFAEKRCKGSGKSKRP